MIARRALVLAGSGALLTSCNTLDGPGELNGSGKVILPKFEDLVRQIKFDVGTYIAERNREADAVQMKAPIGKAAAALAAKADRCPGQISFQIQKVKLTVTTTLDATGGANAGLTVPVNVLTIGASGSASKQNTNTVTTTLTIYPIYDTKPVSGEAREITSQRITSAPQPSDQFLGTPIRDTLDRLRSDLIKTSDMPPCFDFGEGTDQKDNSVKLAFTVVRKTTEGGKFSIVVFSVGADLSQSTTFANTIEVTFIGAGDGFG